MGSQSSVRDLCFHGPCTSPGGPAPSCLIPGHIRVYVPAPLFHPGLHIHRPIIIVSFVSQELGNVCLNGGMKLPYWVLTFLSIKILIDLCITPSHLYTMHHYYKRTQRGYSDLCFSTIPTVLRNDLLSSYCEPDSVLYTHGSSN